MAVLPNINYLTFEVFVALLIARIKVEPPSLQSLFGPVLEFRIGVEKFRMLAVGIILGFLDTTVTAPFKDLDLPVTNSTKPFRAWWEFVHILEFATGT